MESPFAMPSPLGALTRSRQYRVQAAPACSGVPLHMIAATAELQRQPDQRLASITRLRFRQLYGASEEAVVSAKRRAR